MLSSQFPIPISAVPRQSEFGGRGGFQGTNLLYEIGGAGSLVMCS